MKNQTQLCILVTALVLFAGCGEFPVSNVNDVDSSITATNVSAVGTAAFGSSNNIISGNTKEDIDDLFSDIENDMTSMAIFKSSDGRIKASLSFDGQLTVSGQGSIDGSEYGIMKISKIATQYYPIYYAADENGNVNCDISECVNIFNGFITSLIIEEGITEINYQFNYPNLSNVKLPFGFKKIGDNCFRNCTDLENVNFPDGLTEIGDYAFWGCSSLKSLVFPQSLSVVGEEAFARCSDLKEVSMPENDVVIKSGAFISCPNLLELYLPYYCSVGFPSSNSYISSTIVNSTMAYITSAIVDDNTILLVNRGSESALYAANHNLNFKFINVDTDVNEIENNLKNADVGTIVTFGSYNWRVIKKVDGASLILLDNIIDYKSFIDTGYYLQYHYNNKNHYGLFGDWEGSVIRLYLNSSFYNMFTEDEKKLIINSPFIEDDKKTVTYYHGLSDVNNVPGLTIYDNVFLLTSFEINDLLCDPMDRIGLYNGQPSPWWICTNEKLVTSYYYMTTVDENGEITKLGGCPDYTGIRPAIWIKFDELSLDSFESKDDILEFSNSQQATSNRNIYIEFLNNELTRIKGENDNSLYTFDFYDLNNDGTMELFISDGFASFASTKVYTIDDNNSVILLYCFEDTYGVIDCYGSKMHIGGSQGDSYWGTFYELIGSKIIEISNYYYGGIDSNYLITVDDNIITETDYNQYLDSYSLMSYVDVGRKYDLTKEGINSAF